MLALHDLIQQIGGARALSHMLRVPLRDVEHWVITNTLPPAYQLPVWKIAVVHRLEWTPPNCDAFVLRSKHFDKDNRI